MKYHVKIMPEVEAAIFRQAEYIAVEQKSPLNATRWLERIFRSAETLELMPTRCPKAEEDAFRPYDIYKHSIDGFVLLFTIDEEKREIWVIATRGRGQLPDTHHLPQEPIDH